MILWPLLREILLHTFLPGVLLLILSNTVLALLLAVLLLLVGQRDLRARVAVLECLEEEEQEEQEDWSR